MKEVKKDRIEVKKFAKWRKKEDIYKEGRDAVPSGNPDKKDRRRPNDEGKRGNVYNRGRIWILDN